MNIKKALTEISVSGADIYSIIMNNDIKILYFSQMESKHKDRIKADLKKYRKKEFAGYQIDNYIYVNSNLSLQNTILTIVHEVQHFMNGDDKTIDNDDRVVLQQELRAFLAEEKYLGHYITRNKKKQIEEYIKNQYSLNI